MKMADEIISELWKIKDDIAGTYNCDVDALAEHFRTKQDGKYYRVVDLRHPKQADEKKYAAGEDSSDI